MFTILFAAILPPILLVLYIYWRDKYQREPFSQLAKGFFYGILSTSVAAGIEALLSATGIVALEPATWLGALWKAFVGAAIPEEMVKLLFLWLLLRKNPYFDERFDGIVYAVCVGMGFAASENILYLFQNIGSWQQVAVSRAMFAVPGHFMFAVAMGYFYAMLYFGDMSWRKAGRIFWVPVLLHGVYDGLLFMANLETKWAGMLLILFYLFCYQMLKGGQKRIRAHLERDKQINQRNHECSCSNFTYDDGQNPSDETAGRKDSHADLV